MPGGHCPEVGVLLPGLCALGVNSLCAPGGLLSPRPPGLPPPSLSRHSQQGSLVVGAERPGGAELVGTSSAS